MQGIPIRNKQYFFLCLNPDGLEEANCHDAKHSKNNILD